MKTQTEIIDGIYSAREAGKLCARNGGKLDQNPYDETTERHWQWLDAWAVERQQKGIQKYGMTVATNPLNLTEWLQHAYEESLDFKRAIAEINKQNPRINKLKP